MSVLWDDSTINRILKDKETKKCRIFRPIPIPVLWLERDTPTPTPTPKKEKP